MSITKHTSFNLAGSIVPLAVSLFTIPIYLNLIGEARYGVLAIAWLLLGYFGLFDLGLGRATAQRIGFLKSGTGNQRALAFGTAFWINLALGIFGGLIVWPVAHYIFISVVDIETELRAEIVAMVPWLAISLPFATLSGVLTGALIGRERFLELNIISVFGATLMQFLPIFAVLIWGPNLTVIIPVVLLSRALTLFALFQRCLHHIVLGHRMGFETTEATRLLTFGGWVTVTSVVGPMMVILDRMVIGVVSGAAAITLYTIPFQLGERTTLLARSAANALFPRFSGLEENERAHMAREGQSALIAIMTPITAIGIFLIEPFLALWISPQFSNDSGLIGIIILAGFWANSLAIIPYSLIQARGRPDFVAKVHLCEVFPYFAMLYLGLQIFGLPGAALAFSIRASADTLLLGWVAGQLRTFLSMIIKPALIIFATIFVAIMLEPWSIAWFLCSIIVLSLALYHAWRTAPHKLKKVVFSSIRRIQRNRRSTD